MVTKRRFFPLLHRVGISVMIRPAARVVDAVGADGMPAPMRDIVRRIDNAAALLAGMVAVVVQLIGEYGKSVAKLATLLIR